jgi:hemolysin III
MGWAALVCIQDINDRLGAIDKVAGIGQGVWLLFVGGVLYTVGVPFFVRDKRTIGIPDHTIWHLFVMAASAAHYYCVLLYLVPFPYEGVPLPWADACGEACIRV